MRRHQIDSGESGRRDWLLERGTALILMVLVPWLGLHLAFLPGLHRADLVEWLESPLKAIGLATLILTTLIHASLGLRSILMDYISTPSLRGLSLLITRSALVVSAVIGLGALWVLHHGARA